jgi:hypothetical protein
MLTVTYLVVGKEKERVGLLPMTADLGISQATRLAGFIPEEDLAGFYNLCDVYGMMNHAEGTAAETIV